MFAYCLAYSLVHIVFLNVILLYNYYYYYSYKMLYILINNIRYIIIE